MPKIPDYKRLTNVHAHINAKRPGYYADALASLKKGAFFDKALQYATALRNINRSRK